MAAPKADAQTSYRLERTIPATPAKVYEAWTQAEGMSRWMAPADDFTVKVHRADARVGGEYRVEMLNPEGGRHVVHGSFLELIPGKRLVLTWEWETNPAAGNSQVTVDLAPEGEGTHLTLTHDRFPDAETRDHHAQGWTGCIGRLAQMFNA